MEELHPRGDSSSSRRSTPRDAEKKRWRSFILGEIDNARRREIHRRVVEERERRGQMHAHVSQRGVEDSEIDEERTSSIITEASGRATETRRHHRRLITEASRRARDTRRHHRRLLAEPSRRDRFRRE
ncbi:hypothetical protein DY000_02031801 [Brassica cretica]|uniref:IBB domain-containing protein n=1 Tax=Brassica cretica TaxID=69181 RepID=A0ABQ7DME3_BRACR|nr:hypothetical protein DY000_02031801 [Brassica cretica]